MNCFVINLATEVVRRQFMETQLDLLGLEYEIVEAVTALEASKIGTDEYWDSWERPLMDTERACLLSHLGVWKRVASQTGSLPCLILEDDAFLSKKVPAVVQAAKSLTQVDHLTLEVRLRRKTVSALKNQLPGLQHSAIMRLYQDRSGAASYLLWPSGARKLVADAARSAGLADAVIAGCNGLLSYQIEPACAVQLDAWESYGLPPPVATHSTVSPDGVPCQQPRSIAHRFRRMRGQLGLGIQALRYSLCSVRREIVLEPSDFL